jgi:hypothetical protein
LDTYICYASELDFVEAELEDEAEGTISKSEAIAKLFGTESEIGDSREATNTGWLMPIELLVKYSINYISSSVLFSYSSRISARKVLYASDFY